MKKYLSPTLHLEIHLCLHFSPWFLNYSDEQGIWKLVAHREGPEFSYAPKQGPDSSDNLLKHVQLSTKNPDELRSSLKPSPRLLTVSRDTTITCSFLLSRVTLRCCRAPDSKEPVPPIKECL